jgi:xanthine dehydrogenase YagS FAD-binding subunit
MAGSNSRYLAGGTNLLDLMKEDVERPDELIDLTKLDQLNAIRMIAGGETTAAFRSAD